MTELLEAFQQLGETFRNLPDLAVLAILGAAAVALITVTAIVSRQEAAKVAAREAAADTTDAQEGTA